MNTTTTCGITRWRHFTESTAEGIYFPEGCGPTEDFDLLMFRFACGMRVYQPVGAEVRFDVATDPDWIDAWKERAQWIHDQDHGA